ncbi:response regulator [Actomonas aquatica]|uniref:histidine kinase n=1 Tax=Actomonas aquatica TaxID=2866162 RepID=A0ABZ1C670_9BACT|nr:response regulator [Opitutus sp. WL0086]WRQ87222.1 response regulator [Opitutus sp. WL0086]
MLLLLAWAAARGVGAEPITRLDDIWAMSPAERAEEHPLRIEGRVGYVDRLWGNLWFEQNGEAQYGRLAGDPPAFENGMLFRLEGMYVPDEGLSAARTTLTVLGKAPPKEVLDVNGRVNEIARFDRRTVRLRGVADTQQLIDDEHLRIVLIVDQRPVVCWVPPDDPTDLPDFRGRVLEVTGVYSGRVDPSGNQSTIEIWVAEESQLEDRGAVAESAWFDGETLTVGELAQRPIGTRAVVTGVATRRAVGEGLLLRGADGDVWVRTIQEQVFGRQEPVVVAGTIAMDQTRRILDRALVQALPESEAKQVRQALATVPGRVEKIREMSRAQAEEEQQVELLGTVTWSVPGFDFFYLSDLTGGTRVRFDPQTSQPPALYKYLRLRGHTIAGPAGPEVMMHAMEDLGARGHPVPLPVTVRDALAGGVEAQWVEMRGFILGTESEGDWRRLRMTSPAGDFTVLLNSPVDFVATPGSLLRVRGVLETTRDERGLIEQVKLRTPFLHDIRLEEEAPADPFSLPLVPLTHLERRSVLEEMIRLRVAGRVVHARPNGSLVIEDRLGGVQVFLRAPGEPVVARGEVVEVVGILGRDGARAVLRDGLVRAADETLVPAPVSAHALGVSHLLDSRHDARLVQLEGRVVSRSETPREVRWRMVTDGVDWDAWWPRSAGKAPEGLRVGSVVRLTGVGGLVFGNTLRPESFELELRDAGDVEVLRRPNWLTVEGALYLMGGLAVLALLAAGAVLVLRRQVQRQTTLLREQLERQRELEGQLERDRRYRAVGALAGGLAHDFNNHLTTIIGNLSLLQMDPDLGEEQNETLQDAAKSARLARDLTSQLTTLAKGGAPVTRPMVVAYWVERAVRKALPAEWRLEVSPSEPEWVAQLDENQMARTLQILVSHQVRRVGGVGTLTLKVERVPDRRQLRICLSDGGAAPLAGVLESLFDPYGKSLYGDERFDMALAFSVVRRHNGELVARAHNGLEFEMRLPLWEPAPEEPAPAILPTAEPAKAPVQEPKAALNVLVLEDEPTVATVVDRMLHRLGHQVRVLPEGSALVELYAAEQAAGRKVDVVILDLTVPEGMGGLETLARLRQLDPAVWAVASSGYSHDPAMSQPREHGFSDVLRKPYQFADLLAVLQRVRDA